MILRALLKTHKPALFHLELAMLNEKQRLLIIRSVPLQHYLRAKLRFHELQGGFTVSECSGVKDSEASAVSRPFHLTFYLP